MTTPPEQPAPLSVDEFRTLTLGAMSRDQLYRVISAAEAERDALRVELIKRWAEYEASINEAERLLGALSSIANHNRAMSDWPHTPESMQRVARAALGEKP